jgi:hypothetical protein
MQTVTFVREYRHRIDDLREARYSPGTLEVSNEVAAAARKAGALKKEVKPREQRSTEGK